MYRVALVPLLLVGIAAAAALDEARIGDRADAAAWRKYLARSAELAARDRDALDAEVTSSGATVARRAPDGGDFRPSEGDRDRLAAAEAGRLADAVISFQTPSGGWSKHLGYSKGPRQPGMQWTSQSEPGRPPHYQATFDNGATVREIEFLAAVHAATGRDDCRAAVLRGLDFILDAQYPNGGWPQVYPLEGGYHDAITFNDNAMTNVLALVGRAASREGDFALVDEARGRRLAAAFDRGVACVVAAQVVLDGRRTVWCAQHDPLTLEPAAARAFEPAALSGVESAHLLKFLMGIPGPAADVVACIDAGLAWLEAAEIRGLARVKRDGRTAYEPDPSSEDVFWARFYDLATGAPTFPGKNGTVYRSYAEMAAANTDIGYDYYSTQPGSIVRTQQKKWRKRLQAAGAAAASRPENRP